MYKIAFTIAFILFASISSYQVFAVEILGGGGNAADKLILDWSTAKFGSRTKSVKFSNSINSNDVSMLQNGKIDFAILDTPFNEAELARMNLLQIPFALNGISIVVNVKNTMEGTLRLDSQTLGKIFSGEITKWDDPAIAALNPKHDLPSSTITIIHSGNSSTDYSVLNSYIGDINEIWKSGEVSGQKRTWPANSIYAEGITARIASIKKTPYSISYLPMQYMPQPSLSAIHIQNRDGSFLGLSDTGIIASASTANVDDGQAATLSLINKNGRASWPLSTFTFIVVNKNKVKDEKIVQLLNTVQYGLKYAAIKPTEHNFVALPDQISKSVIAKIDTLLSGSNKGTTEKSAQDGAKEAIAIKQINDAELQHQRIDPNSVAQEANRRIEEKNRSAKLLADEAARDQAIKEAKAAKHAADEAIKAANAAKIQAEQLAEKNRLIAKAEKEKADKEKAEKERIAKEQAEKEKAIRLRNQKDEDPLEAYRRSISQ
jgi:phosphate transport system substrate-binding protein